MSRQARRPVAFTVLTALAAACLTVLDVAPAAAVNTELLFSEYVEGSSNNKALEIYNGTGAPVDLAAGGYQVEMYFNGSTTVGLTVALTGTVADGDVFVLANSLAAAPILAVADQTGSGGWFNGDDAVVLRKAGFVVDSIGDVGADPGIEWGTGATSTADNTLRRQLTVVAGDTVIDDAFDPAVDWDGFATDTFDGLGGYGDDPPPECTGAATEIATIQGNGTVTPLPGASVTTGGIVTGDFNGANGLGGFYMQDDTPDADPNTSEGIFVASSSAVAPGDRVEVCGTASESFGQTQVAGEEVVIQSTGNGATATIYDLPRPEGTTFEPVESMLLTFPEALTATEHFQLGRFGEITVSSDGRLFQPTDRVDPGPPAIALAAENARRRLLIDDGSNVQNPATVPFVGPGGDTLRIGDTATGITGVLGFGFSLFRLQPTAPITFASTNPRLPAPADVGGDVKVATFNTLNYFTTLTTANPDARGANSAEEFARQQAKEVAAITGLDADVIGLMEVENNGTTAIGSLVDALNAATAPGTYAFVTDLDLTPPNGFGGTFGTDAIKVALIYKPAVVTPTGSAQSTADAIFDRPPLVQTFTPVAAGEAFTVVVNHFKSKNCAAGSPPADEDQGDGQSCFNGRRVQQAQALDALLDSLDPPNPLIVGDLNAYTEEDPIQALEAAGYTGLSETFVAAADRYSFVFDGSSGELDHAMASPDLLDNVTGTTIWHIDADEPLILDYNLDFGRDPNLFESNAYRASDHDPLVIGLAFDTGPVPSVALGSACAAGGVRLALINSGDQPADFVVDGGSPITVPGPGQVPVFVPVTEGASYSIVVTVDGNPVPGSPIAGERDCQALALVIANPCATSAGATGVKVVVTNTGAEAAPVTIDGITKVVQKAGGQRTWFVAVAEGASGETITATSSGNAIAPLTDVARDCQLPVLSLADDCAYVGVPGVKVAVDNTGDEAALVTIGGVVKKVKANGGRLTWFVALANGAETTVSATSPGNDIASLTGVSRDCGDL